MAESAEVVAYVLEIDAKDAERSLRKIEKSTDQTAKNVLELAKSSDQAEKELKTLSREAKQSKQSIESMSSAIDKGTREVREFGKQSNLSAKDARNLRRAGRDIDGAFGDLAQGLNLINPAFGSFAQNVSSAASVADGLGRTLVAFTNPAFVATTALIGGALAAIKLYQITAGQAAAEQKKFADEIEFSNAVIRKQQALVKSSMDAFDSLTTTLEMAKNEQRLLRGEIEEMEFAELRLRNAVNDRADAERKRLADSRFGLIRERMEIEKQFNLQKQRIQQNKSLFDPQAANEAERSLRRRTQTQIAALNAQIEGIEKEQVALEKTNRAIQEQVVSNENLRRSKQEREKEEANAGKNARERESERLKALQEQEALIKQIESTVALRESSEVELQRIILKGNNSTESQIALINLERDLALSKVEDMVGLVDDENLLIEAQLALFADAEKQVDAILGKQMHQTDNLQEQIDKEKELAKARLDAMLAIPEDVIGLAGDPIMGTLNLAAENASGIASGLGASASVASMAGPIATAAVGAIGALAELGQKTPEQIQEEALATTEAIVQGISILPTLLIRVLPPVFLQFIGELTLALAKLPFLILDALIAGFDQLINNLRSFFTDPEFRKSLFGDPAGNIRDFFGKVLDPNVDAFAGGGRLISAQGGIRFTGSQNGLAMLHQGEFVVPQSGQRPQQVDRALREQNGGNITINVNGTLVERNALDALVRRLEQRFGSFGQGQTSLFGRS